MFVMHASHTSKTMKEKKENPKPNNIPQVDSFFPLSRRVVKLAQYLQTIQRNTDFQSQNLVNSICKSVNILLQWSWFAFKSYLLHKSLKTRIARQAQFWGKGIESYLLLITTKYVRGSSVRIKFSWYKIPALTVFSVTVTTHQHF